MKSRKLKLIIRFPICLVVGFMTSIGVAWLAAYRIDSFFGETFKTSESPSRWICNLNVKAAYVVITSRVAEERHYSDLEIREGPRWSRVRRIPTYYNMVDRKWMKETACGWPMLCLVSAVGAKEHLTPRMIVHGIPFGTRAVHKSHTKIMLTILPTRPIWFGLLVNTSMYSIIIWFVLSGRILLRNSIRRKRGLCTQCKYNIRDLPVCPECGSGVGIKNEHE